MSDEFEDDYWAATDKAWAQSQTPEELKRLRDKDTATKCPGS